MVICTQIGCQALPVVGNVEHSYQLHRHWPLYCMFRKVVLEVIHVRACICSGLFYTSMLNGIHLQGFVRVVKLLCKVPHNRITKPSLIYLLMFPTTLSYWNSWISELRLPDLLHPSPERAQRMIILSPRGVYQTVTSFKAQSVRVSKPLMWFHFSGGMSSMIVNTR